MKQKIKFFAFNLVFWYLALSFAHLIGFILFGTKAYIMFRLIASALVAFFYPIIHPQSRK